MYCWNHGLLMCGSVEFFAKSTFFFFHFCKIPSNRVNCLCGSRTKRLVSIWMCAPKETHFRNLLQSIAFQRAVGTDNTFTQAHFHPFIPHSARSQPVSQSVSPTHALSAPNPSPHSHTRGGRPQRCSWICAEQRPPLPPASGSRGLGPVVITSLPLLPPSLNQDLAFNLRELN